MARRRRVGVFILIDIWKKGGEEVLVVEWSGVDWGREYAGRQVGLCICILSGLECKRSEVKGLYELAWKYVRVLFSVMYSV